MNAMNPPAMQKTSGLAITSLVLGIISLCCPVFLLPLAAVICGHIARGQINKSQGTVGGGGVAMAGLILGYLSIALSIVATVAWIKVGSSIVSMGLDTAHAQQIQLAMEKMVTDGETKGDKSLGWPADAGIASAAELKKRLVDNGYLSGEGAAIDFSKYEFGNVSSEDPESTVFIKLKSSFMGVTMYFPKFGPEVPVSGTEDISEETPKRTPAFLAP